MTATPNDSMVIAFDIDDTITRHPRFFAVVTAALVAAGHRVLIISYREEENRSSTVADLDEYGVRYSELILHDGGQEDFYGWKANVCRERGVEVFFEDMQEVIREVDEKTLCLMAIDREIHDLDRLCQR